MDEVNFNSFIRLKGTPPSDIKLLNKIDEGGISDIWLASHPSLSCPFVVKYAKNDISDNTYLYGQFEREFEASQVLLKFNAQNCSNIIADFNVDSYNHPYLYIQYFPSKPLDYLMNSLHDWNTVRIILARIIACLHTIHSIGIIHRDIKPANILVNDKGDVRIIDFALSTIDGEWHRFHSEGFAIGTPKYMAPEQAYGQKNLLTAACDWYALGIMLYEWLSGNPPFKGNSPEETIQKHCLCTPSIPISQNIPNAPDTLPNVILSLLDKKTNVRFHAVRTLRTLLEYN